MSKIKSKIIIANAGSGKTYSIVQHIKEIIASGDLPSSILCITFTNAGRDEMQERLLRDIPNLESLPKIVTFHSLCNEIVNAFTHELSMPYGFELDESDSVKFAVESALLDAESVRSYITKFKISPTKFTGISSSFFKGYHKIHENHEYRVAVLKEIFGIKGTGVDASSANKMIEEIINEVLQNIPLEMLQSVGGVMTEKYLPKIMDIARKYETSSGDFSTQDFMEYCSFAGKSAVKKNEEYVAYKEYLKEKVHRVHDVATFQKCMELNAISNDIISIIEQTKRNLRKYTFDDLIHKTLLILENPELRDFAIFKFGSTFSHILVDEAQDTNENQWQILSYFIEEQIAGGIANGGSGSLFIVGDTKQTIYSFQGAKANIMGEVYEKYSDFLEQHFLTKSFRTTQPVLDVVNNMPNLGNEKHISNFPNNAGFVRLLNVAQKIDFEEVAIAQKTLDIIQSLIGTRISHEKYKNKILEPQDFAILLKERNPRIISALKEVFFAAHVPVSFNDKVDFSQSFCVLDFIAMLKLCIIECDGVALYGILKSPMFKLEETSFEYKFSKNLSPKIEDFPQLDSCIVKFRNVLHHDGIYIFFKKLFAEFEKCYSAMEQNIIETFIETTRDIDQYSPIEFIQRFQKSSEKVLIKSVMPNAILCTTAHSSKGLEFPIVIYIEGHNERDKHSSIIFQNGVALSVPPEKERGQKLNDFLDIQKEFDSAEDMRLYYVAISRAAFGFCCISSFSNSKKDESFFKVLQQSLSNLECTHSTDETFGEISYSKYEHAREIVQRNINAIAVENGAYEGYFGEYDTGCEQTQGEKFGTFIHKLFEDSDKNMSFEGYLQFSELFEDFPQFFEESLQKIHKANDMLKVKFKPLKIEREKELFHNGKVLRLDAIYFCENEIIIIDYKTQEQIVTQEIREQLAEYVHAVEEIYGKSVSSFVLWWQSLTIEKI